MDNEILDYINATYKKIRLLKRNEKSEVYLLADKNSNLYIYKHIFTANLPYNILKEIYPSICPKIIFCYEENNETIVIEEYISGKSLSERIISENFLSESEAKQYILDLLTGLKAIHDANIIHRDIKPSNLIESMGKIYLTDFDIARTVKENASHDTAFLGTKGYASPEQFGYGQTDKRSDIYSLGVTFKELLGKNYKGRLLKILNKATELDPKRRYSSAEDMKNAILSLNNKKTYIFIVILTMILIIFAFELHLHNAKISQKNFDENYEEKETIKNDTKNDDIVDNNKIISTDEKTNISISEHKETQTESAKKESETKANLPSQNKNETENPKIQSKNYVRIKYFLNGRYVNGWMENFKTDITNAGSSLTINKALLNNGILNITNNFTVRIENDTDSPIKNPCIKIIYLNNDKSERKIFNEDDILPKETRDIAIPLGKYEIHNEANYLNRSNIEVKAEVFGDTPHKILGSKYTIAVTLSE